MAAPDHHISAAAITAAKLWGWGPGPIGGNHFRSQALRVGLTGLGEDWNACEYGDKQDRYHEAFHVGSSQS